MAQCDGTKWGRRQLPVGAAFLERTQSNPLIPYRLQKHTAGPAALPTAPPPNAFLVGGAVSLEFPLRKLMCRRLRHVLVNVAQPLQLMRSFADFLDVALDRLGHLSCFSHRLKRTAILGSMLRLMVISPK